MKFADCRLQMDRKLNDSDYNLTSLFQASDSGDDAKKSKQKKKAFHTPLHYLNVWQRLYFD